MATYEQRSRVGQVLKGKYVLEQLLGEGAMAQVYRAHNQLLGRTVAIKCLHPNLVKNREVVGRFLREARAANSVRHRNIVDVIDIDTDDKGVPFLVEEYLEGQDLGRQLESTAWRLSPQEALEFFIPIAEAVGVAHAKRIVHRDLKPDNIFLASIGGEIVPKVLDFGISKVPDSMKMVTDTRATAGGRTMGTPVYMSPEQIRDPSAVDARGDVWSLGVMLYEALCGELPFEADDVGELFQRIHTLAPQALQRVAPYVPAPFAQVVHRCLMPDPAARYADATALAEALKQVQQLMAGAGASEVAPGVSQPPLPVAPPLRAASEPPPGLAPLGDIGDDVPDQSVGPGDSFVLPSVTDTLHSAGSTAPVSGAPPSASEPPSEASPVREVERAITAALSRKGIGGTVVVRDNSAELHGAGPNVVAIDLGDWVSQWNLLPPDMCDRRAETAALRLSNAMGRSEPSGAARRAARGRLMKALGYAVALLAVAAVVGWLWDRGFFGSSSGGPEREASSSAEPPAPETTAEAAARTARACEAARQRLYAGAAMGVDVEGWLVELWLARKPGKTALHQQKELESLARQGAAGELGASGAGAIVVKDAPAPEVSKLNAALVQLDGGYTASFFTSEGRDRFVTFAERIAKDVGASHAALFARCAHLTTRDVGVWYLGPGPASATATLVYAAGGFVEPPAFDRAKLGGQGDALELLATAIAKAPAGQVEDALRTSGGRVEGAGPSTIRFPLGGPTRASKVSRDLAKLAGL